LEGQILMLPAIDPIDLDEFDVPEEQLEAKGMAS
jgi:hypothetical protein